MSFGINNINNINMSKYGYLAATSLGVHVHKEGGKLCL